MPTRSWSAASTRRCPSSARRHRDDVSTGTGLHDRPGALVDAFRHGHRMIRALEPEEASLDEHAGLLLSEREIDEGNLPVASEGVTRHRRASLLRALDHLVHQVAWLEQEIPAAARRLQALGHAVGEDGIVPRGHGLSHRRRLPDFVKTHASAKSIAAVPMYRTRFMLPSVPPSVVRRW